MKNTRQSRWIAYGQIAGLVALSFAMLGWGVHAKTSLRLHADMSAHESAIRQAQAPIVAAVEHDSPTAAGIRAKFEFVLMLAALAALLSLRFSAAWKMLRDTRLASNPETNRMHFRLHRFSLLPPPTPTAI
jgi:hypothetical protein